MAPAGRLARCGCNCGLWQQFFLLLLSLLLLILLLLVLQAPDGFVYESNWQSTLGPFLSLANCLSRDNPLLSSVLLKCHRSKGAASREIYSEICHCSWVDTNLT